MDLIDKKTKIKLNYNRKYNSLKLGSINNSKNLSSSTNCLNYNSKKIDSNFNRTNLK